MDRRILIFLQSDGRRTNAELAKKVNVSPATCHRRTKRLFDEGLIYRGNYMVNWSPKLQTALSDDEVEHREVKGSLYGGAETLAVRRADVAR